MSITIPTPSQPGDFKPLDPGTYPAVIAKVANVGLQKKIKVIDNVKKEVVQHEVCFIFELDERDKNGKRMTVMESVKLSGHERSRMFEYVRAAYPTLKPTEVAGFDAEKCEGRLVMLGLEVSKDGKWNNIRGISAPIKGLAPFNAERDYREPFGLWKVKVDRALPASAVAAQQESPAASVELPDEDLPF